ncbi:LpqB family beta-propeller domain-containing protein [Kitasatospora sp. RB6PN24]|uniref:LpqB family beta-propeller domain-containing protein n=1 Tax=Kitasatospora humi TaxID=2893891 RepID=UPI001E459B60|nr:LpqB family beta-propeller domain-containing protein [Kitasatospora humi]MCC9312040.1 LpqB family beta-propeller domain-containing protein [Kitasatospora humi]
MASASGVPGRRWAGALGSALTVLLAAGCATMPDSGSPEAVAPPQGAGADQGVQVRVLPMPPRDGLTPAEVLQNFLDASSADEADYKTAKEYLTGDALTTWQPDSGAVVVSSTTVPKPPSDTVTGQVVLTISSHEIGTLDTKHTYHGTDDTFTGNFTLVNAAKDAKDGSKEAAAHAQWRIASLPTGLVLDATSFRNAYEQVDRYFFTKADPQAAGADQPVLVPDPVYLRRRIDPASAAARALGQGASDWLAPAVRTAFDGAQPAGTVNTDDPRNPKLQVDGVDCQVSQLQCHQMAAQLYFTLASLTGPGSLDRVTVVSKHGSADLTTAAAKNSPYAPGGLAGSGRAYVRNAETGQLDRLQPIGGTLTPVPGVLGQPRQPAALQPTGGTVGPYAVRRDGGAAAVVSGDGKDLYVSGLDDGSGKLGAAVITSRAPRSDEGLASPSWDGYGDLFVVDRDPVAPRVLMNRGQSTATVSVDLADGQTVDGLRVSSDGTRAALLVRSGSTSTVEIGRIDRGGTAQTPSVAISELRSVVPAQLSDVASVSWADPDTLLVLGKEADGLMQLHYLSTDGSSTLDNALPADNMTVVAASEARTDTVLGDAKDQDHTVYGLFGPAQPQWRTVGKDWALPSYPD